MELPPQYFELYAKPLLAEFGYLIGRTEIRLCDLHRLKDRLDQMLSEIERLESVRIDSDQGDSRPSTQL